MFCGPPGFLHLYRWGSDLLKHEMDFKMMKLVSGVEGIEIAGLELCQDLDNDDDDEIGKDDQTLFKALVNRGIFLGE